jgi:ABC-type bacteriocin/lantibiotic exporter with double-glycine peptidase domain
MQFIKTLYRSLFLINFYKPFKIYLILFLILSLTVLEIIGIGLIVPLIYLFTETRDLNNNLLLSYIINFFNTDNKNQLIIFISSLILFFFITKNIILLIFSYLINKITYNLQEVFSYNLFKKYILMPWYFFLQTNSSVLIRNVLHQASDFSSKIVMPFINLIKESLMLLILIIGLLFIDYKTTAIVVLFFFIFGLIYQLLTKNFFVNLGKKTQHTSLNRLKFFQEAIFLIKELKILNRKEYFLNNYRNYNILDTNLAIKTGTLTLIPKIWFELISIIFFCTTIIFIASKSSNEHYIPKLVTIFFITGFKLLPSFNKIVSCFQTILIYKNITDNLYTETLQINKNLENNYKKKFLSFKNKIKLSNISFHYLNQKKNVLDRINLDIKKNTSIGIFGPSGCGKTTLVEILCGLLKPQDGDIFVDKKRIHESFKLKIGYATQNVFLIEASILKNIAVGVEENKINLDRVNFVLKISCLNDLINKLPNGLNTNIGERGARLSSGQKQRLGIARALYSSPEILIFDESTNALDKKTESLIFNNIFNMKITFIVISHKWSLIKNLSSVYKFNKNYLEKFK